MLEVKKNKIKLTRGDTAPLNIAIRTPGGEPYEPEAGETCRFAISTGYLSEDEYELILEKDVPLDTCSITLSSTETKIPYGTYNYDVQITHNNGAVETFISSTIEIIGEVE